MTVSNSAAVDGLAPASAHIQAASSQQTVLHRRILRQEDLDVFLASDTFASLHDFLCRLNEAVKGRPRPTTAEDATAATATSHPVIAWLRGLLEDCRILVQQHPPQSRTADVNRFGNPVFREWIFAVQERILPQALERFPVPDTSATLLSEIGGYFANSLGSSQRIDYGTGHELHFLAMLHCVNVAVGGEDDIQKITFHAALVLLVFSDYLQLMRTLQQTYWLEPAGSHGVWGLDDYHFLPFLLGSAQLCGHAHLRPRAIHSPEIVLYLAPAYIYFDSIRAIIDIKTQQDRQRDQEQGVVTDPLAPPPATSLRWMSPVLDDISAVRSWDKVNGGLLKMWRAEVTGKLPIMQHFLFGATLSFPNADTLGMAPAPSVDTAASPSDDNDSVHYQHSQQGDCCGNPLPSVYASTTRQPGLPFD